MFYTVAFPESVYIDNNLRHQHVDIPIAATVKFVWTYEKKQKTKKNRKTA